MAYCKNCGAYIPDGQTTCLACGAEDIPMGGQAAQTAPQQNDRTDKQERNELLRKQLEEQRKKQQENNRKWAEAEYTQRRKAGENNRQYNEQRKSNAAQGAHQQKKPEHTQSVDPMQKSKIFAVLSYLSALFILPYLFCRDDKFALYHAKQGLILFIVGLVAEGVGSLLGLGWAATLLKIYFIFKGMDNAAHMRMEPLPYIGNVIK